MGSNFARNFVICDILQKLNILIHFFWIARYVFHPEAHKMALLQHETNSMQITETKSLKPWPWFQCSPLSDYAYKYQAAVTQKQVKSQ